MNNIIIIFILFLSLISCSNDVVDGKDTQGNQIAKFYPALPWKDVSGKMIDAHGGGVLFHKGVYYWYGAMRTADASGKIGVSAYSSEDLYNWKFEGAALPVSDKQGHDIELGCKIERPKVIYNEKTGKFVMWFHLELKGQGYKASRYGVAVSDSPIGPFEYKYSSRSCVKEWPINMSKTEQEKSLALVTKPSYSYADYVTGVAVARDLETGQMSRDMTIFINDDGKAYHIYTSEDNRTIHIAELADDFISHTGRYTRVHPGGNREAPALFKRNGVYWMITSGCTGWDPNPARLSKATHMMGEWELLSNPCVGNGKEVTFYSQGTFVLPVVGKEQWIFMADQWKPNDLSKSTYVWLPIEFEDDTPVFRWHNFWSY